MVGQQEEHLAAAVGERGFQMLVQLVGSSPDVIHFNKNTIKEYYFCVTQRQASVIKFRRVSV
jgi:hypothetical protein